jgi:hypothetical protein
MRPVVDHVPFAVADLEAGIERFEAIGLRPERGGMHPDAGTEMAQIVLPDGSYLECIAPTEPRPRFWGPYFERAEPWAGPCGWCVETGSVHAECQRLIDHDVTVHGPMSGRRTRPDGTAVEWDAAFLGEDTDQLLPFLIADRTPRSRRVPDSTLHGGPLSGIARVVLGVQELSAAVERLRRLYRLPTPEYDVDTHFGELAWFPGQDLLICAPEDGPVRARVDTYGPGPVAVLLGGDLDEAVHQYPLSDGREWLGRRVRFVEGFDHQLGVIDRR